MITIRKASERGHFDFGWLKTHHTFSFGDYFDPKHEGFRDLRVINEDFVAAGAGFPTHPHRDMEIVTYVLDGALEHKDSLGTGSVITPGEIQRMSAGSGIRHSEFNHSPDKPVHLLQIWIHPAQRGIAPGYEQKTILPGDNSLRLVASPDGKQGSVTIHSNASILATRLKKGGAVSHKLAKGRHAWVQVARGGLILNGQALGPSDGAAVSEESEIKLVATTDAEVLVFDLG